MNDQAPDPRDPRPDSEMIDRREGCGRSRRPLRSRGSGCRVWISSSYRRLEVAIRKFLAAFGALSERSQGLVDRSSESSAFVDRPVSSKSAPIPDLPSLVPERGSSLRVLARLPITGEKGCKEAGAEKP